MSLEWDSTKCNRQAMHEAGLLNADKTVNHKVIHFCFQLMAVGIPAVTPKTLPLVIVRIRAWEAVVGSFFVDQPYTEQEIMALVGYSTNNSTKTATQFQAALVDYVVTHVQ